MAHNVFYRDFTLCKAFALVGLIGLALMLSLVPDTTPDLAEDAQEAQVIPVVYRVFDHNCDADVGVKL
jgi:hypothetical protein